VTPAKINSAAASSGQALTFNGTTVVWSNPRSDLALPFSGNIANNNAAVAITNTGTGRAGFFTGVNGIGVEGMHTALTGDSPGVRGETVSRSDSASGVLGIVSNNAPGDSSAGVRGVNKARNNSGIGVYGLHTAGGVGVLGETLRGRGVFGYASGAAGINYGVFGATASKQGFAGFFDGNVKVTGELQQGTAFIAIDHPLDPANKYLQHASVQSPDMMNIYNGIVVLDANGEAWVELPRWFEALNRDFRYQLTPIGAPAPNLYLAEEVSQGRFKIAGGEPALKVSWQVSGIRHDPYAEQHRFSVEQEKPSYERGYYLHPAAYGMSQSRSIRAAHEAEMQRNGSITGQSFSSTQR
jgi:hypothetical protein